MHNIIQDVPDDGVEPSLDADLQVYNAGHANMPEIMAENFGRHLMLETAASALGAASGKEIPLSVDAVVFINTVLGINELGDLSPGDLYGDLWVLKRDENGVPLHDDLGCVMPIASEPIFITVIDENGEPQIIEMDTVPMMLEEYMDGLFKCAPVVGYEDYVTEVEMGRLNLVRSTLNNPGMLDRHLFEVVNRINAAVGIKRDLAGRIVLTSAQDIYDENGFVIDTVFSDSAIDSPLENMAIYRALMKSGTLEVPVTINIEGTKETFTLEVTLPDEILNEHGMGFLKNGDGSTNNPQGIGHHTNGYADLSEVSHCPWADYGPREGFDSVPVDFVERQDDFCPYDDQSDFVWSRVLDSEVGARGEDDSPASNIAAFVQHADDSRLIIVFIHSVIQDPLVEL